ncbi:maleylpyruvate isomerase family mycothiol-dependent enzyme [Egicoccus sp. AB-alg6-2]|uniref:maleylpyruvate isomerase family mycothiol-dependent enzyme n=1 Tax=Egicoccus sp. AB-alg6-2 TaxID=3242692 RepID=UPI00359E0E97
MSEVLTGLVAGHRAVYDGLLAATDGLDDPAWRMPTGCPGWSVHDQLAHCIGTERLMLGHPLADVEVPDLPHLRSDFGRQVERDVEARRNVAAVFLREEAEVTFVRRQAKLEALVDADLDADLETPLGRMPARRGLRMRLFDLTCHEEDVRRALGLPVASGPHVEIAVVTATRSLAAVLPRRLPDAAGVVAVTVDGAEPVAIDAATGALLPPSEATPDATLTCTTRQFLALTCGRSDAPAAAELDLAGDLDLARQVVAVAGFTP